MTSQSGNRRGRRTAIAGGLVGGAVMVGLLTAGTANADVLDDIAGQYETGTGGGQVSNIIKQSVQLRNQGFRPSKGNIDALQEAMAHRPNQVPLIDALKETVTYQRQMQAQAQGPEQQGGFQIGMNQLPPGQAPDPTRPDNTGIFFGPRGGVQQQFPAG